MPFRNYGTGGTDTSDATATAANVQTGYSAYVSTGKVDGELVPNARAVAASSLTVPSAPTVSVTAEIQA
jgi:hypothetical protein